MIDTIINLASMLSLIIGIFFIITGSFGLLRLSDVFSRIHAAGMIDTAGASFTSPITGHVTANLARKKGVNPIGKSKGKTL